MLVGSHPSPRPRPHATNATHCLSQRNSLQLPSVTTRRGRSEPLDDTRALSRQGGSLESLQHGGKHDFGGLLQRIRNRGDKRRRNGTTSNATQRNTTGEDATQPGQDIPRTEDGGRGYATRTHKGTTRTGLSGYDHGLASCGQTRVGGTRKQDRTWLTRLHRLFPRLPACSLCVPERLLINSRNLSLPGHRSGEIWCLGVNPRKIA